MTNAHHPSYRPTLGRQPSREKRVVTILAVPFRGERRRRVEVHVDITGGCRVWDAVAEHWTLCHALTEADCERARKHARRAGWEFENH